MISMAQLTRHRADAATIKNELFVSHTHCVRSLRTDVNVENALATVVSKRMVSESKTMGAKLKALAARSGRSYREIAANAGFAGASSVQRYFTEEYDAEALPVNIASKLARGFAGSKVRQEEIMELAGLPSMLEAYPFEPGPAPSKFVRDVPVYGTALGTLLNVEGAFVEQTFLDQSEVISFFARPQSLSQRKDVYGVYIQGSSMAPRFQEGEMAFVESLRPPQVGDDVLVFLVEQEDDGERYCACLIKRLVRRSASFIELEQFNPSTTFRIDTARIKNVHRVIPWGELLA